MSTPREIYRTVSVGSTRSLADLSQEVNRELEKLDVYYDKVVNTAVVVAGGYYEALITVHSFMHPGRKPI